MIYGKVHAMKSQLVGYPNGMIGVFFALVSHNDKGMVRIADIEEELERVLANHQIPGGQNPSLVGGSVHEISTVIIAQGDKEGLVHERVNQERASKESIQGLGKKMRARLGRKKSWKFISLSNRVNHQLLTVCFTLDFHFCARGNSVSSRHSLLLPSLA